MSGATLPNTGLLSMQRQIKSFQQPLAYTHFNDYRILIVGICREISFFNTCVETIPLEDLVHRTHIDCDTNWQRHRINLWLLAYLHQVGEDSTERRSSSADQLHWILMTDIFHTTKITENKEKNFTPGPIMQPSTLMVFSIFRFLLFSLNPSD